MPLLPGNYVPKTAYIGSPYSQSDQDESGVQQPTVQLRYVASLRIYSANRQLQIGYNGQVREKILIVETAKVTRNLDLFPSRAHRTCMVTSLIISLYQAGLACMHLKHNSCRVRRYTHLQCVQSSRGSRQPMTGRLSTHASNTRVKIQTLLPLPLTATMPSITR